MFKLRVKIKLYWTAMINKEPEEAEGYIEGYSGDEVLIYLPNSNELRSIPVEEVIPIGYEEVWVEKETKE